MAAPELLDSGRGLAATGDPERVERLRLVESTGSSTANGVLDLVRVRVGSSEKVDGDVPF